MTECKVLVALEEVRGVLDKLTRLGAEPYIGNSVGNVMASAAIGKLDKALAALRKPDEPQGADGPPQGWWSRS